MEEKAVVDRIEDGQVAVLLVGDEQIERVVPVSQLPPGAVAGSWLWARYDGDRLIEARLDAEESEQARQRIAEKMGRLRQRGQRL